MTPRIRGIGTALPRHLLDQNAFGNVLTRQDGWGRLGKRLVGAAFASSAIETRRTVLADLALATRADEADRVDGTARSDQTDRSDGADVVDGVADFLEASAEGSFYDPATGAILAPSTGTRNDIYVREATTLFVDAARAVLAEVPGVRAEDLTHLVTASCTGFFAPGPDYEIIRRVGLRVDVKRQHLGFMGCNAAFPALRAASDIVGADPSARVLVVCAEVCSIHLRLAPDGTPGVADAAVSSSLFGDGAAAAIVTADGPGLAMDRFATMLTPTGEDQMAWSIGDTGFEMLLGAYVPKIIDGHIIEAVRPILAPEALSHEDIPQWAVHPGGRSILDRVATRLGLSDPQMEPSRAVLRELGNMSSASVMFVLDRLMTERGLAGRAGRDNSPTDHGVSVTDERLAVEERAPDRERVVAMAFGPGLTVETALLSWRDD